MPTAKKPNRVLVTRSENNTIIRVSCQNAKQADALERAIRAAAEGLGIPIDIA